MIGFHSISGGKWRGEKLDDGCEGSITANLGGKDAWEKDDLVLRPGKPLNCRVPTVEHFGKDMVEIEVNGRTSRIRSILEHCG
jgi:hypothetical protein